MRGYFLRRVLTLPLVVLAVYTVTFFLARATPGGPWSSDIPAPPSVIENLRAFYHADEPLLVQYWDFATNAFLHGDLGPSYVGTQRDVSTVIAEALPISLEMGIASTLLAIAIGVLAGIVAAVKRGKAADYAAMAGVMFGISVPAYVTTPLLVLIFSITLHWLPSHGWKGLLSTTAIIPIVALALGPAANVARYTRTAVLDVIQLDYVQMAVAKGLPARVVLRDHVLRNALLPIITVSGLYFSSVLTHTFYVEYILGIPGIGRLAVESIFGRDYPVILGVVLVVAVLVAVTNVIVDLLYARADPRIRYG